MHTLERSEYGSEVPLIYPGERLTSTVLNERIDKRMEMLRLRHKATKRLEVAMDTDDLVVSAGATRKSPTPATEYERAARNERI